jgi:hypothetical protein
VSNAPLLARACCFARRGQVERQVRDNLRELVLEEPHTAPKAERLDAERHSVLAAVSKLDGGATSFGTVDGALATLSEGGENSSESQGNTPVPGGTPDTTTPQKLRAREKAGGVVPSLTRDNSSDEDARPSKPPPPRKADHADAAGSERSHVEPQAERASPALPNRADADAAAGASVLSAVAAADRARAAPPTPAPAEAASESARGAAADNEREACGSETSSGTSGPSQAHWRRPAEKGSPRSPVGVGLGGGQNSDSSESVGVPPGPATPPESTDATPSGSAGAQSPRSRLAKSRGTSKGSRWREGRPERSTDAAHAALAAHAAVPQQCVHACDLQAGSACDVRAARASLHMRRLPSGGPPTCVGVHDASGRATKAKGTTICRLCEKQLPKSDLSYHLVHCTAAHSCHDRLKKLDRAMQTFALRISRRKARMQSIFEAMKKALAPLDVVLEFLNQASSGPNASADGGATALGDAAGSGGKKREEDEIDPLQSTYHLMGLTRAAEEKFAQLSVPSIAELAAQASRLAANKTSAYWDLLSLQNPCAPPATHKPPKASASIKEYSPHGGSSACPAARRVTPLHTRT